MSFSAIFTLFLNTCREADSTTSQGFSQKELYVYIDTYIPIQMYRMLLQAPLSPAPFACPIAT